MSSYCKLIAPIAMEEGLRFAYREGGRTVGAGVVSKIIEIIKQNSLRPVAQLAEQRSPKPQVGGSIPSWPANEFGGSRNFV